jgi:hypothetical protein
MVDGSAGGTPAAGRTRRAFVRGLGALTVLGSGCSALTSYEFAAPPVVLPPDARRLLGYGDAGQGTHTVERTREVGGTEVTATIESAISVYRPEGATGPPTAPAPTVGVVSTPRARLQGRAFNPLTRLSLANLLTSDAGTRFLRRADLDRLANPGAVTWVRGPRFLAGRAGSCLDAATQIDSYAGVLAGEPNAVAFVHLTRVAADSVVVAAAVHGHEVQRRERAFVGQDGFIPTTAFEATVETYRRAIAGLAYAEESPGPN